MKNRKNKKSLVVVLDFDRTLYNTDLLIARISEIFKNYGIDFEKLYKKVKIKYGLFSFSRCLEMIKDSSKREAVEKSVYTLLYKKGQEFLFSDVMPFLRELKKKGAKIILLTKVAEGGWELQRGKINGLGQTFRNFFCCINITHQNKTNQMLWICNDFKDSDIFFIDDGEKEISEMRKTFGDRVICIKMSRGGPMVKTEVPNLGWASQTIRDLEGLDSSCQKVLIGSFSK